MRLLLSVYKLAKRSGLLRTRAGDALFTRAYFAYKKFLEDPHARLIRANPELFEGGHVLDVGANIGYTATIFAAALSKDFNVFAFEPEQENFSRLERTIARHHLADRVRAFRFAVGAKEGSALLQVVDSHHGDHHIVASQPSGGNVERVPLISIDHFVAEHLPTEPIRFVKIDVQGYEPMVLRGMRTTLLSEQRMALSTEVHPSSLSAMGSSVEELSRPLVECGYAPHVIEKSGRLAAIGMSDIERLANARDYIDVVWRRG